MNRFTTRTGTAVVAVAAACVARRVRRRRRRWRRRQQPERRPTPLTLALDSDAAPERLRPAALLAGPVHLLQRAVRRAVRHRTPDGTVEPSLVTEFENNAENTADHADPPDGVTFADGSTLDAELVKANLDRRSDPDLEAYGALGAGSGASEITDVTAPDAADRRHHLGAAAGDAGEQPRRHRRRHRRRRRRRRPRLAGDHAGRLRRLHAQRGRDDAGQHLHARQERRGLERRRVDLRLHRLQRHHRPRRRWPTRSSPARPTSPRSLDPTTIELVESRQSTVSVGGTIVGFPVTDKTGATNPAFAERGGSAGASATPSTARRSSTDLHPGARPTSPAVPRGRHRLRPGAGRGVRLRPRQGHASCSPRPACPDGFEFNITVLGQPTEDQVAIQSQLAEVGITMNFVTATSTDQVFAAVNTDPVLFGPVRRRRAARPASSPASSTAAS